MLDCKFELYDLTNAIEWIVKTNPRVFRLIREGGRTGHNSRQSFVNYDDVRDDPAYNAICHMDPDLLHDQVSGYWITEQSTGAIKRDVFMQMKKKPATIRFLADCIAGEVNYAINRIRAIPN